MDVMLVVLSERQAAAIVTGKLRQEHDKFEGPPRGAHSKPLPSCLFIHTTSILIRASSLGSVPRKSAFNFSRSSPAGICRSCLLYTSDAADEEDSVDLGGR